MRPYASVGTETTEQHGHMYIPLGTAPSDPDPTEPPGISRLTMALRARREIDDRYQNDTKKDI